MILVFYKMTIMTMMGAMLSSGCKRQPVRSSSLNEDLTASKFIDLASADGNLKSAASYSSLPPCSESVDQPFYLVADNKRFYRCASGAWQMLPVSIGPVDGCRSFDVLFDVANTGGAEPEVGVKFLGMACDGAVYLIKDENGLIPVLSSASINLGDKELSLRATYFRGRGEQTTPINQPAALILERPTAIEWSAIPKVIEVSPGGHAGTGQLVILSMNSDRILCTYRSDSRQAYHLRGCWEGAQVDMPSANGVAGGVAINMESKSLVSLDAIKFSILGAETGYVTSAMFTMPIQ
jgi:hypothetical protein